jgi:hypothetical protein
VCADGERVDHLEIVWHPAAYGSVGMFASVNRYK